MALSLKNRLSLKENREKFFESGKSIYSPLVQVIVLKESLTENDQVPQFAVSISKKVAKKAHDRNKLRRQIQQLIQKNISLFPVGKYLFLPKKTHSVILYSELVKSFDSLLLSFPT